MNGQLESAWPVFGSIPVDEHGLFAIAGRHFDADGGLWWYQLDPPTGRVLASGRLGRDELSSEPAFKYSKRPLDGPCFAEVIWEHNEIILKSRSLTAVPSIAVCDNAVYLGMSVENSRDRQWREAYAEMPHRLRVLDFETGNVVSEFKLPARVQQGGIALADGKVFVAMEDGSILALCDATEEWPALPNAA